MAGGGDPARFRMPVGAAGAAGYLGPMPMTLRIFAECGSGERAADGWVHIGDEEHGSSVWSCPLGGMFLPPEVKWAELIWFDEGQRHL